MTVFASARAGQRRLLLLGGDAGAGKTTLVQAFVHERADAERAGRPAIGDQRRRGRQPAAR
ncbi:MAG: hypothetical protein M3439_07625 [Chloroflexota bacterium]|nr:hypothetical protein [Chloroflexota bacterium]